MAFKLPNRRHVSKSSGEIPVFRKQLDDGVIAEANNDGSIYISRSVKPGSKLYNRAIKHEMKHIEQMETGKANYGDEWVSWNDNIYFRKEVNGENVIDGPNGRWPEGHPNHPWEAEAIKAEKE